MMKKDQKWEWIEQQEKAFKELKERFTKKPVLAVPDLDKKNEDGSWYIGLYYRRGVIYEMWRWEVVTNSFSLKISKQD